MIFDRGSPCIFMSAQNQRFTLKVPDEDVSSCEQVSDHSDLVDQGSHLHETLNLQHN